MPYRPLQNRRLVAVWSGDDRAAPRGLPSWSSTIGMIWLSPGPLHLVMELIGGHIKFAWQPWQAGDAACLPVWPFRVWGPA